MKSFKDLTESSLSRIQKYWIEYDTGTITAFRGAEECGLGATITKKQNKGRNGILQSKLLNRGYGVTRIKGSWFENAGKEKNEIQHSHTHTHHTHKHIRHQHTTHT